MQERLAKSFIAATKVVSGVRLDVWEEIGLPPCKMTGELFEVTGGESDLSSPHLWWVTNIHLLSLSVTASKTDVG